MTTPHVTEEPTTDRWSALGGVLLSALYLWVVLWLLLAVLVPSIGLGWRPVVITTGSMAPLIRPGDVVLSAEAPAVEPGQVITYEDPAREGTLTTHRIVSVNDDGSVQTQGDANTSPDSTAVPAENVLGRGRLLVPLIGLPLLWLSGGAVLFGLWVVVTAISVAVVAGATGTGGPPAPTNRSGRRRVTGSLLRFADRVRPRRVQRLVVGTLVRQVQRLHDAVYRGWRPNPSRLRRGAPSLAIIGLSLGLARTPVTVAIGVVGLLVVVLFDPDGPQLRIGRWERLAMRAGRVVSAVVPSGVSGRAVVAVAMLVAVSGSMVGRSTATFSAAADNTGSTFTAASAFPTDDLVLYLQNDPEGADTLDQTFQPMTTTVPTQTTLPNYDTNTDNFPGLKVKQGGADQYETDDNKVQRWTYAPSSDLTIASAQVVFDSALKDFDVSKDATVEWYLRHCDGSGSDCIELAEATITEADWSAGQADWVERTTGLGAVNHVVPAGRQLELAVIVSGGNDLWFAYDTAAQQSRLELVTATPGVCPGSGMSVQHVQADTWVEEEKPTDNLSTDNELEVVSELGKNKRSLLTVALPTIPDGCTMTGATLHLTTTSSDIGRTIEAQRTDTAFDPTTVTWATQPTSSGAIGSGPSAPNGPTPIDVLGPIQDLYADGNTGLVLRDSVESEASKSENRFRSIDSKPYPDPEGPRLEVTWGP